MPLVAGPEISRRHVIIGVLGSIVGSVPLVVLPARKAEADTLAGVYHGPTGYDELYATTPTERSPRDPMDSQLVSLHSTTWPVSPGQTVWITWTKNGVNQTPVGASFDYNSGNNTYWKADLGTFARGDEVTYTVNANVDGSGQQSIGPFSFSVTGWSGAGDVSSYLDNGTTVDLTMTDTAGSFTPRIRLAFPTPGTMHVQIAPKGSGLTITGSAPYTTTDAGGVLTLATANLQVKIQKRPYRVSVYKADGTTLITQQYDPSSFRSTNWASDGANTVTKIEDHWRTPAGERWEGLGERYDYTDQRGHDIDNYVYNQYQDQGPTHRTYLSVPFTTNSNGYAIYVPSTRYSIFNIGTYHTDMAGFTVDTGGAGTSTMDYYLITGSRAEVLDEYTTLTARPLLPPKWAFGLWMSANEWNTQSEVMGELANVTNNNIPHSVLVLEQWSDEATFYLWHGCTYTPKPGSAAFRYSDLAFPAGGEWSDPKAMVDAVHAQNMKVVLWQIPVLKQDFDTNPPTAPQQHINDRDYALAQNYVIGDGAGGVYRIPTGQWFGDSTMPDFTNSAATAWWMSKRAYLFDDVGIDGMKCDGGEMVFGRSLTFADGRKGDQMHNAYPNSYTGAYSSFVQTKTGGNGILYSRGGTTGAQANSIYWSGDQSSTFSSFQQSIRAGITAGVSGIPFWSWDLAGFTGSFPSSELYLRAAAAATFMPIMQYHSEKSDPSPSEARTPWNVQARTGDTSVIPTFRTFANVRMNLIPYLFTEAKHAADTGLPIMQAMGIAFPTDATAGALDGQFMCGRQLLVTPITSAGATSASVYLPAGEWHDFFFDGKASGAGTKTYFADTAHIPVYARAGAIIPLNLNENYELGGNIGNSVTSYPNLIFRVYPSGASSYDYYDDAAGVSRTVTATAAWSSHRVTVSVPALTTTSTLQVDSSTPGGVTKNGAPMTARTSLSDLIGGAEGWYWDPVVHLTHVKIASGTGARTIVLSGVDKAPYEAEFASTTGTTTNTNHPGYTGTDFVDGFESPGDSVSFDVWADSAATYQLKFRYGNGSGSTATRTVRVDDALVGTLSLPNLGTWDTWGVATIGATLSAGRHAVKIAYESGDTTGINLDNLTVVLP